MLATNDIDIHIPKEKNKRKGKNQINKQSYIYQNTYRRKQYADKF